MTGKMITLKVGPYFMIRVGCYGCCPIGWVKWHPCHMRGWFAFDCWFVKVDGVACVHRAPPHAGPQGGGMYVYIGSTVHLFASSI